MAGGVLVFENGLESMQNSLRWGVADVLTDVLAKLRASSDIGNALSEMKKAIVYHVKTGNLAALQLNLKEFDASTGYDALNFTATMALVADCLSSSTRKMLRDAGREAPLGDGIRVVIPDATHFVQAVVIRVILGCRAEDLTSTGTVLLPYDGWLVTLLGTSIRSAVALLLTPKLRRTEAELDFLNRRADGGMSSSDRRGGAGSDDDDDDDAGSSDDAGGSGSGSDDGMAAVSARAEVDPEATTVVTDYSDDDNDDDDDEGFGSPS